MDIWVSGWNGRGLKEGLERKRMDGESGKTWIERVGRKGLRENGKTWKN